MRQKFSKEIFDVLEKHKIPHADGLCYLLSIDYGVTPSYIPREISEKISDLDIFELRNTGIVWNISLFEKTI